ncbi:hypothetical protein GINT2_002012 [Glugoides intestinalis]
MQEQNLNKETLQLINLWKIFMWSSLPGGRATTTMFIGATITLFIIIAFVRHIYFNEIISIWNTGVMIILYGIISGKGLEILFKVQRAYSGAYGDIDYSSFAISKDLFYGIGFLILGSWLLYRKLFNELESVQERNRERVQEKEETNAFLLNEKEKLEKLYENMPRNENELESVQERNRERVQEKEETNAFLLNEKEKTNAFLLNEKEKNKALLLNREEKVKALRRLLEVKEREGEGEKEIREALLKLIEEKEKEGKIEMAETFRKFLEEKKNFGEIVQELYRLFKEKAKAKALLLNGEEKAKKFRRRLEAQEKVGEKKIAEALLKMIEPKEITKALLKMIEEKEKEGKVEIVETFLKLLEENKKKRGIVQELRRLLKEMEKEIEALRNLVNGEEMRKYGALHRLIEENEKEEKRLKDEASHRLKDKNEMKKEIAKVQPKEEDKIESSVASQPEEIYRKCRQERENDPSIIDTSKMSKEEVNYMMKRRQELSTINENLLLKYKKSGIVDSNFIPIEKIIADKKAARKAKIAEIKAENAPIERKNATVKVAEKEAIEAVEKYQTLLKYLKDARITSKDLIYKNLKEPGSYESVIDDLGNEYTLLINKKYDSKFLEMEVDNLEKLVADWKEEAERRAEWAESVRKAVCQEEAK